MQHFKNLRLKGDLVSVCHIRQVTRDRFFLKMVKMQVTKAKMSWFLFSIMSQALKTLDPIMQLHRIFCETLSAW